MSTENEHPVNADYREVRRKRKEEYGRTMSEAEAIAEQANAIRSGWLTEEDRLRIERGTKPGIISRLTGYALGGILAGGSVTLLFILMIKAILWAVKL